MSRVMWLWVLLPGIAWAHGFHVEARWTGEQVAIEAYFSSGDVPGSGQVVVRRGEDEVARGELDGQGAWSWTPPAPGTYRIEVTEPGLHKAFTELVVPAVGAPAEGPATAGTPTEGTPAETTPTEATSTEATPAQAAPTAASEAPATDVAGPRPRGGAGLP